MKLTPEQIDRLYKFTRQHYVEWYDLQTELVDHLANSIEVQWQENPKVSFEDALQMEFKKFGIFGFMDVVEKRQEALNKRYNKIVWQHFKAFFTIPKIVITLFSFFLMFFVFRNYANSENLILILFFGILTLFWISLFLQSRKNKKQYQKTGKKWLLKEIIFGHSSFAGLSYLPVQILINTDFTDNIGILKATLFSLLFVSMALCEYIILVIIPSKAEDYLKETYPEYALENESI
ncbi:DUF5392 family protein [Flavobacterium cyclinae]|uniref:DUF5392 family protein n=1 Tax=Flavobacterium cyclinae TaxID=2895947 RepID=UPI001E497C80|nr:DUF5392 family protein [Flavobacterium cyclinae]UGS21140.1 DUF5392 family protein [Flavobacterium cyclinae]